MRHHPTGSPGTVRLCATLLVALAVGAWPRAASAFPHRTEPAPGDAFQAMAALLPPTPEEGGARYHFGAALICSDCHVMHASMEHGWAGGTVGTTPVLDGDWLGASGPSERLLKAPSSVEICLACHDGRTFAPDVLGADANALVQRSAGFFGDLDAPNYRGHNLARGLSSNPDDLCNRCHFGGSMGSATVQCIDCHARHGNGHFRNLQWASAPGHPSEPEIRAYTLPGATGMQRYEAANVRYPSPAGSEFREVTNICIDCHHVFMDDSGGYYTKPAGLSGHWGRHPGTNTEWGARRPIDFAGAATDPTNWVGGTGSGFDIPRLRFLVPGATNFADAGVVAANNEVFCLSCHQAHGNEHAFGLRWAYGEANFRQSAGCRQCHASAVIEPSP